MIEAVLLVAYGAAMFLLGRVYERLGALRRELDASRADKDGPAR